VTGFPNLEALLFDFDGLLVDTEFPEFTSITHAAASVGATIEINRFRSVIGTAGPGDVWVEWIEEQVGPVDRVAVIAVQHQVKTEMLSDTKLTVGSEALLEAANHAGIRCAVVSASHGDWVLGHLNRLRASHYFVDFVTRDRVLLHKPDPAHYLSALDILGINRSSASSVVAFEDSYNGSRSSAGAGITTVVVPHGLTDHADFSHAHHRVASLAEITLPSLTALVDSLTSR
jgi:HAD superfamily hydrolase (TIGR01509 family)